jgi:hypothetical protein
VQAFAGGHTALPSTLLIRRETLQKVGALRPELYGSEDSDLTIRLYEVTKLACVERVLVKKLQRGNGYRDMAFDEAMHRDKILLSREKFLSSLAQRSSLTHVQRAALDREWANYFLLKGRADRQGRPADVRRFYWQAIKKAPFRLRGYTRFVRTLTC